MLCSNYLQHGARERNAVENDYDNNGFGIHIMSMFDYMHKSAGTQANTAEWSIGIVELCVLASRSINGGSLFFIGRVAEENENTLCRRFVTFQLISLDARNRQGA